jgi:hypothetical protein
MEKGKTKDKSGIRELLLFQPWAHFDDDLNFPSAYSETLKGVIRTFACSIMGVGSQNDWLIEKVNPPGSDR